MSELTYYNPDTCVCIRCKESTTRCNIVLEIKRNWSKSAAQCGFYTINNLYIQDIKFCTCTYTHTVTVEDEDKLPTSTESQEKESMECDRKQGYQLASCGIGLKQIRTKIKPPGHMIRRSCEHNHISPYNAKKLKNMITTKSPKAQDVCLCHRHSMR